MAYRDKTTGRFASKASYNRSKAQGGTRFVQTQFVERERPEPPTKEVSKGSTIRSLQDYYDEFDYPYDSFEFETGLDYGEE